MKIRIFSLLLVLLLSFCALAGCDGESLNEPKNNLSAICELYEQAGQNDFMPFEIVEKAKKTLNEKEKLFTENQIEDLEEITDYELEYKILTKNIDKHGDKLMYIPTAYVVSIDETDLGDGEIFTEMHILDENDNSYYVLSLNEFDNIYEEDAITLYALPLAESSFDNVSGGTTLVVVLASCYIEKIEG